MSDLINRTLKRYHAKAFKTAFDLTSSRPKGELIGECDYFSTSESDRVARAVMGIKSKNILIVHEFIDENIYSMSLDTFNENATSNKILDAVSRSCSNYKATAYKANGFDDEGAPIFEVIGTCDYIANKQSDIIVKRILNIGNIQGVAIAHELISNNCLYMDYQKFVSLATVKE